MTCTWHLNSFPLSSLPLGTVATFMVAQVLAHVILCHLLQLGSQGSPPPMCWPVPQYTSLAVIPSFRVAGSGRKSLCTGVFFPPQQGSGLLGGDQVCCFTVAQSRGTLLEFCDGEWPRLCLGLGSLLGTSLVGSEIIREINERVCQPMYSAVGLLLCRMRMAGLTGTLEACSALPCLGCWLCGTRTVHSRPCVGCLGEGGTLQTSPPLA